MARISNLEYQGALRTKLQHIRSGKEIITDAPLDNKGKGEAFSPTDLVASALVSCAITVMGIRAQQEGFEIEECSASVEKEMGNAPRKINGITIHFKLKADCDAKMRKVLEGIGRNCPVAKSLAPELTQDLLFNWL